MLAPQAAVSDACPEDFAAAAGTSSGRRAKTPQARTARGVAGEHAAGRPSRYSGTGGDCPDNEVALEGPALIASCRGERLELRPDGPGCVLRHIGTPPAPRRSADSAGCCRVCCPSVCTGSALRPVLLASVDKKASSCRMCTAPYCSVESTMPRHVQVVSAVLVVRTGWHPMPLGLGCIGVLAGVLQPCHSPGLCPHGLG